MIKARRGSIPWVSLTLILWRFYRQQGLALVDCWRETGDRLRWVYVNRFELWDQWQETCAADSDGARNGGLNQ
jgi:hypothetical protein